MPSSGHQASQAAAIMLQSWFLSEGNATRLTWPWSSSARECQPPMATCTMRTCASPVTRFGLRSTVLHMALVCHNPILSTYCWLRLEGLISARMLYRICPDDRMWYLLRQVPDDHKGEGAMSHHVSTVQMRSNAVQRDSHVPMSQACTRVPAPRQQLH